MGTQKTLLVRERRVKDSMVNTERKKERKKQKKQQKQERKRMDPVCEWWQQQKGVVAGKAL